MTRIPPRIYAAFWDDRLCIKRDIKSARARRGEKRAFEGGTPGLAR